MACCNEVTLCPPLLFDSALYSGDEPKRWSFARVLDEIAKAYG